MFESEEDIPLETGSPTKSSSSPKTTVGNKHDIDKGPATMEPTTTTTTTTTSSSEAIRTQPPSSSEAIHDASSTPPADPKLDEEKGMFEKLPGVANPANWGWGGISNWGSNVLSTATTSMHTLADSVSGGVKNVLDTVEYSLVDPAECTDPVTEEEEKRLVEEEKHSSKEGTPTKEEGEGAQAEAADKVEGAEGTWFKGWGIDGLTKTVQKTTKSVTETVTKTVKDTTFAVHEKSKSFMSGGLDVLETIGKKTYDVLAEGDHGLKQTIKKTKDKPNLSQLLREAKEQAASHAQEEEEFVEMRKSNYSAQFDEFQGLVQLEALEMLSNQCESRVFVMLSTIKGQSLESIKRELVAMKMSFELDDMEKEEEEVKDHDFDRLLAEHIGQVGLNITPEKTVQAQERIRKLLSDCLADLESGVDKDANILHQQAIQSLAEFTARSIDLFHRVGQLVLLEINSPVSSFRTKSNALAKVTKVLCVEIGIISNLFTECFGKILATSKDSNSVNPFITNVFLEASNSSTYIQDAFQLLLPSLQQGAIEAHQRAALHLTS